MTARAEAADVAVVLLGRPVDPTFPLPTPTRTVQVAAARGCPTS